jgi:hypothetical protein
MNVIFKVSAAAVLALAAGSAGAQCIVTPPASQNACPGQTIQLRVVGGSFGSTYQWFRNGTLIPGATGTTLSISNIQQAQAGQYTVRVTGGIFGCNVVSAPATVTVFQQPTITSQPASTPAALGESATFSVGLGSGVSPSQIFWTKDGVAIPGATGPSLTIPGVKYLDIGSAYRAVIGWPCGSVTSQAAILGEPTDPASVEYYRFVRSLAATEVVRSNLAKTYNPVLAVTIAAVAEVAARNPNATREQLEQFATAYQTVLRGRFADDPDLKRGFNLQTAVAFSTPVTSIPGLDTNIGGAVLERLGMDHNAPNRTLQMIAFQGSLSYRFATSDKMATLLGNVFADRDAAGEPNASVQEAVATVLRAAGVEPYPTAAQLRQLYPEVARGIDLIPSGRAAFLAEQAAGFPAMRAALDAEYAALKSFIDQEIDDLKIYKQQYPTLESTYNAAKDQQIVSAALANRAADLVQLNQSRAGISFATAVMARDAQNSGPELALERQFANLNVDMASAASDSLSTALQGASVIVAAGVGAAEGPLGMVGAVGTLLGGVAELLPEVFPQDNGPSPLQMVSDQITDLSVQVDEIRVEMTERFNRIDSQLTTIASSIDSGFAAMVGYFQGVNSNLESIQTQVATAQTNLNRMEQNLYGVLADGFNFPFIISMDTYLNYRDRNNQDIARADYIAAEGAFYSAATNQAVSQTYAGPNASSLAYDATAIDQLNNFPLGYNINNLRVFPAQSLGLPSLGSQRVPNPMSWSLNADAYAQLGRENPWYMAQTVSGDPTRVNTVLSGGQGVQAVMSAARNAGLMNRLRADHTTRAGALQTNLDAALSNFMTSRGLAGSAFDLWGGPDQPAAEVPGSFTYPVFNTRILRYGDQCSASTVSLASTTFAPHSGSKTAWNIVPNAVFDAAFLGLPGRSLQNYFWTFRFNGEAAPGPGTGWQLVGSSGTKYAATVDVELWWSPNHGTTTPLQGGGQVMRLGCGGPAPGDELIVTRRYEFRAGPADEGMDPSSLFRTFLNRWTTSYSIPAGTIQPISTTFTTSNASLDTSFEWGNIPVWTAQTIVNPASLASVQAAVNDRLRSLQAEYYSVLLTPLAGGAENSNIKAAADLMSVPVQLMDSYLSLGAPESFAQSDVLRGMFRGSELRMDRDGAFNFFQEERDRVLAMTAGSAAPTARPSWGAEVSRRWTLLQPELDGAVAGTRTERYPFMNWTIANLDHLKNNARRLAADDTYVTPPDQTLVVPASAGLLVNDVLPPRDGSTPRFSPTAILDLAPSVGSLSLSPTGGFSYTPPAGFTGEVSFRYRARGDIQAGAQNLVDSLPASVVIRVQECAPVLTSQPQDKPLELGGTAGFSVGLSTASGRVAYQWRKNGVPMADDARIVGTDGPNLVISNLTESDRASYDVVVTAGCGSVTSYAAGLGYCASDINLDGQADLGDFFDFLNAFDTGLPLADLDRDGIVDLVDFFEFLNRFDAPC